MTRYPITPVPAPRQTRFSRFNPKHAGPIARYQAFRDEVRARGVKIPECARIIFELPVPSKAKHRIGLPHQQKPDLDNCVKAILDAVHQDDCRVWRVDATKRWAAEGAIWVGEIHEGGR